MSGILSSRKSQKLLPPPLAIAAPLCAFDDIAEHRTLSPSNLERGSNFKTYENKFHEGLSNRTNRDLAAELAAVERLTRESSERLKLTMKYAKIVDPTKSGVGSAGGHIARKLGARGPLNGNSKLKPKYPFTPKELYDTTKKDLMATKGVTIQNPDWEPNFVVHNTLEPPRVLKHPPRRRDTSKSAIEFEVADIMVNRGITPLPAARLATRKSRLTLNGSTLKKLGVDAYRVRIDDKDSGSETASKNGQKAESDSATDSFAQAHQLREQSDLVRPYTTGSYNPSEFISANRFISLDLRSVAGTSASQIQNDFQAFGERSARSNVGYDVSSASSVSGRGGPGSYSQRNPGSSEVFIKRIDAAVDRLLGWLHEQGAAFKEVDSIILAKKLQSQQRQLSCLPGMCYICVLMGLPPTVEAAVQLFGKHSLSATQFLETIDPLSLPMRNIRKATILKEKLIDTAPLDENTNAQRFAPEWKLRNWIKLFHVLAEALIVVYNVRKERMGGSITSLMSSSDALPVLPTENNLDSGRSNPNNDVISDEKSYKSLIRSKFCHDLLNDQTCFDFWRIVFADGDSSSNLEVIETSVPIAEQDVLFVDVAVDEYNVDGYFADEQVGDSAPPTPIDGDIKLGLERAAAAHLHANDTTRKAQFGRAASMPSLNAAGIRKHSSAKEGSNKKYPSMQSSDQPQNQHLHSLGNQSNSQKHHNDNHGHTKGGSHTGNRPH